MSVPKPPMRSYVNADSVEYRCPCGAALEGEGDILTPFIAKHRPHTNGRCIETITADGERFCAPRKPRTFKL